MGVQKATQPHVLTHLRHEVKTIQDHTRQVQIAVRDHLEEKVDHQVVRVDRLVHEVVEDNLFRFPFFTLFNYNLNIR